MLGKSVFLRARAAVALVALSFIAATVQAGPLFPNPAKPASKWRLAWSDEFNGPPCDLSQPSKCSFMDWTRTVQCFGTPDNPVNTVVPFAFHVSPNHPEQFTTRYIPHLAQLDKCNWLVSDHVNKIHFQGPAGPIARYDPANVAVSGGEMRITTRRARGPVDCGRKIDPNGGNNESNLTKDCPYTAGNVFSYGMHGLAAVNETSGMKPGDGHVFADEGRIEIRARIPAERGNMTALWTWQQDWNTPQREFDLLENWVNWPDASLHSVQGPNTSVGHTMSDDHKGSLSREFHTYSMEWKTNQWFNYYLDNRHLATWRDTRGPGGGDRVKVDGQCVDSPFTPNPFYMIMWNLMMEYEWADESARPLLDGQKPDTLYIDHIRYYQRCDPNDPADAANPACVESTLNKACPNPCAGFGAFDGYNCYVGDPPAGREGAIKDDQFAYKAKWSLLHGFSCPSGGVRSGSKCLLGGAPAGRSLFVHDNHFYTAATCSTTRLPNCSNPCPRPGTFYDAATGSCRGGSGSSATIYPIERCPYGGTYQATANVCVLESLPMGTQTFAWEGGLYYRTDTHSCPHGGTYDGANCFIRKAPDGSEPFIFANFILTPAQCGPATDWQALQKVAGKVTLNNVCTP